jgi:hypothetical protein
MPNQTQNRIFYWTKDAFSLDHTIYDDGNIIGVIKDKSTDRSAKASILGKKFLFESEGFFKPGINIYDIDNKKVLGRVKFHWFRVRAEVRLSGHIYHWNSANFINSKWTLKDEDGVIKVAGAGRKEGYCTIENSNTPLLLLTSLVIRNHFTKQGQA